MRPRTALSAWVVTATRKLLSETRQCWATTAVPFRRRSSSSEVRALHRPYGQSIQARKDRSALPRQLGGRKINLEYNPNVAPTEQVPVFLRERDKAVTTRLARFGIN